MGQTPRHGDKSADRSDSCCNRAIHIVSVADAASAPKRVRLTATQRCAQLLDIAEELFTRHGYEGVSIEDIARAAHVTRPIVYQHYGSREGVFLACVARARRQFEQSLLEHAAAAGSGITDQIYAGGEAYFDLIEDDPARFVLLVTSSSRMQGPLGDELSTLHANTINVIASAVRQRHPGIDGDAALALAYTASGVGEQLGRWWLTKPTMPKGRLLSYYAAVIRGAIGRIQIEPVRTVAEIDLSRSSIQ